MSIPKKQLGVVVAFYIHFVMWKYAKPKNKLTNKPLNNNNKRTKTTTKTNILGSAQVQIHGVLRLPMVSAFLRQSAG